MRHLVLSIGLAVSSTASAGPFTKLALDDALEREGLVVAHLAGDGACTGSDDGWSDSGVAAWVRATDTLAVSVRRTAANLHTVVGEGYRAPVLHAAWKGGAQIDRVCGCLDGANLVRWLAGVAGGTTWSGLLAAELEAQTEGDLPVGRWLEVVKRDHCADRTQAAFDRLAWLWDVIPTERPDQRSLRLSRIAHDMGVIARKHPPAEQTLVALRDALDLTKDSERPALDDWVALNRILLDDERTLTWFAEASGDPSRRDLVRHQAPNVFFMLAERDRWAEAGALIDDVDAWLDLWKQQQGGLDTAAWGYAALLAAGETGEAAKLAKRMLKVAPEGTECKLLAQSTEAGAVHRSQSSLSKKCEDSAIVDAWAQGL